MRASIEIMNLVEVAQVMRLSPSSIRHRLTERRKGRGDFPMPISGHRERLAWLRSEIESHIQRRNHLANHCTPVSRGTHPLSAETLQAAAELGLLNDIPITVENPRVV